VERKENRLTYPFRQTVFHIKENEMAKSQHIIRSYEEFKRLVQNDLLTPEQKQYYSQDVSLKLVELCLQADKKARKRNRTPDGKFAKP